MSETDTQSAPRKTPAKSSSAKGGASRGKPIKKRGRKIKYQTALQAVFKTIAKEKAIEDLQMSAEAMQIWDAAIVDLMKRMIAKAFKYAQQTGKSTLQATHAKLGTGPAALYSSAQVGGRTSSADARPPLMPASR